METNEFSFVLKPAAHGVGVFATHDIAEGTYLRLFGPESENEHLSRVRKREDVPEAFLDFCIDKGDTLITPADFGAMPVGWYLNHSAKDANAIHRDLHWYAARDIKAGEEILIDYNSLGEPEEGKDEYYAT